MPENTTYSRAPIPVGSDADRVPADLKKYATHIDPLLNLKAADEAERNSLYADVPNGTLVSGTTRRAIWQKRDASWDTVWALTPWTRISLINSFTEGQAIYWSRVGEIVYWRGALKLPAAESYPGGSWMAWANVPTEARPIQNSQRFAVGCDAGSPVNAAMRCTDGQMMAFCGPRTTSWLSVDMVYRAA